LKADGVHGVIISRLRAESALTRGQTSAQLSPMNPPITGATTPKKYNTLYIQVLVAIVIGILLGHFWPDVGVTLRPFGDGFIKLVKMLIAPIIFATVVAGLAGMGDMKRAGRVGARSLIYFEVMTTLALILGLVVSNVFQPGAGMHAVPTEADMKAVAQYTNAAKEMNTVDSSCTSFRTRLSVHLPMENYCRSCCWRSFLASPWPDSVTRAGRSPTSSTSSRA